METNHGKFQQLTLKFDDLKGLPSSSPSFKSVEYFTSDSFSALVSSNSSERARASGGAPSWPLKGCLPEKKGWKRTIVRDSPRGFPPQKKRNKSQQLRVTAVLEALVCIFLALNWVFSCSSWHWNHWNHWKTAGKPLEITGVELSIYWDAQSYFGGGSWATQVSEIPL